MRHPTVTIEGIKVLLINYEQMGFSAAELLRESGIDTRCLENNHHHISPLVFSKLFKAGMQITGDPHLGLHIGDQSNLDALGIVGQIYRYSRTVREGSRQIEKYLPVIHTLFTYRVEENDQYFSIIFQPNLNSSVHQVGMRQLSDLALAYNRQGIRHATQRDVNPLMVWLQYDMPPSAIGRYEEVLQCEIKTGCPDTRLVYDKAIADLHHLFDNPTLAAGLEQFAKDELERIHSVGPYTATVRNMLKDEVEQGIFSSAATIAAKVGLSVSSLKRLLAAEKTSFQRIREEVSDTPVGAYYQVISPQEKERSRIARELHDGVSGLLAAAKMHFSVIREKHRDFKDSGHYLTALSLLDDATSEVRKTAYNLMPEILLKYGLHEALQRYCRNIGYGKTKVEYLCTYTPPRYDGVFELGVYRMGQELIHNAIKHARPTQVNVNLHASPDQLLLQVTDDGCGFNPEEVQRGIGLDSVQERAEKLGGSVNWKPNKPQGTKVQLVFNLK
jgi:signal transduction histidine kinase